MKNADLLSIPGVGKSIVQDLRDMGIHEVADLKGRDPERMYVDFCALRGQHIDRCMLYVMRCAVYFAEHVQHPPSASLGSAAIPDRVEDKLFLKEGTDPEKLKWWNWKDSR